MPRLSTSALPVLPCSSDPALVERERARFLRALQPVLAHTGPKIIVTDSQVGVAGGVTTQFLVCSFEELQGMGMGAGLPVQQIRGLPSPPCWPAHPSRLSGPHTSLSVLSPRAAPAGCGHPAPLDAGPSHWRGTGAVHHL